MANTLLLDRLGLQLALHDDALALPGTFRHWTVHCVRFSLHVTALALDDVETGG